MRNKMYMVLYPSGMSDRYEASFTSDVLKASDSLQDKGVTVYSLDGLTQIRDIQITYKEIPVVELT